MATATSQQRTTATSDQNKELIRQVFEALNRRDKKSFAGTHREDVVLHDLDDRSDGIDAAIEHEWATYAAFPDITYSLEDMVAENDKVACRWTVTGTHKGAFQGMDPTGKTVEFAASGMFRVENQKVAEVWLTYDRLGMMQQLGALEPSGQ